ncbi:hypothetical protein OOZ51_20950 [Arthrobacter sp. MI7-26]|uniref:hypothetical protein n=1 Tax=Arthrobacter sp. MI7-26 TaxID=2993653 RepID=UPI0022487EED|nr:hypothetical protein [Arthrobacter sp. MI7-26]MCX2750251.1 hypothetical protein [Arthrobacter sp. MI7-26]
MTAEVESETAFVPAVQLDGQMSINDVLLELGWEPVVYPSANADAGDFHIF